MYAIMETGGKQYRVSQGDVIEVELLTAAEEEKIVINKVLAIVSDEKVTVGNPFVEGAQINCKVLNHGKGKKVVVFKYKPKKNIRKKNGHRQPFTKLQIESISL